MFGLEAELARYNALVALSPDNPKIYISRGMVRFKLAQIEASIEDFDRAESLDRRLTPYLWQRGLSYYYLDRFDEGAKQFEIDRTVNANDGEESLWHYLCIARSQGREIARERLLAFSGDPRTFLRSIYDLYSGKGSIESVFQGENSVRGNFYRYLYLGLYHEVMGDVTASRDCIRQAVYDYKISDYMWDLGRVHLQLRHWS